MSVLCLNVVTEAGADRWVKSCVYLSVSRHGL